MKQHQLSRVILGVCLVLSGCAQDRLVKLDRTPKQFIERWDNPGMTPAGRLQDNATCGGSDAGSPQLSRNTTREAQRPGEKEHETYTRLFHDLERCMIKKGYRYTGKCYDNEVGRASPACAGRVLEPLR